MNGAEPAAIEELHQNHRTRHIARVVTESDSPREELDEHFTSKELYRMLFGGQKSKYTTKDQRIEAIVRRSAKATDDYRHFANDPTEGRGR